MRQGPGASRQGPFAAASARRIRHGRGRGSRWLLLAAAGIVSLLLLEGALRALGAPRFDACEPPHEHPWQPDPEAFRVLRPHVEIGVGTTNALGLRGPVLPETRTPGIARVLYLGDSTCWGVGVVRERTFAARGAELAAALVGRPVEIVNGCIPGHSSFQSRAMLRRLLRFAPDVVVLYIGARNDPDRHRYFRDAEIPARLARRDAAWHRVRVLQAAEAAYDGFYKKLLRKPLPHAWRARVPPSAFRQNLEAMLDDVEAAGSRGIVLMPPWSVSLLERYPLILEYQHVLEETALVRGATFVPLQPAFLTRSEADVYQADRLHFSEAGHELAARELAPAIATILGDDP